MFLSPRWFRRRTIRQKKIKSSGYGFLAISKTCTEKVWMKMKRSQAREEVFRLLFESAFNLDYSAADILERATDCREFEADDYIKRTFFAVSERAGELDEQIDRYSVKWKADRLTKPALCAARLAVYEILYADDVPAAIAINEAVELIKKYDGEESARYVNGFLGSFVRDHEKSGV